MVTYTCEECQVPFYLYKQHDSDSITAQTVCVPHCSSFDLSVATDEPNRQCVYLGPYCISSGDKLTDQGQTVKECIYSPLTYKGYILDDKSEAMSYYNSTNSS